MKISAGKFEEYLSASPANFFFGFNVILVFGPDQSSVRNYIDLCLHKLAGSPPDPFKTHSFSWNNSREMAQQIIDSLYEISLFGGLKTIHVRHINDLFTSFLKDVPPRTPTQQQNLLLLEADDLPAKSSLRKLIEFDESSLAIPCYLLDDREQLNFIQKTLHKNGLESNRDGLSLLKELLPNQKQTIVNEIEKISMYCRKTGLSTVTVTVDDIVACLADQREISLQDVAHYFAGQQIPGFVQHYYRCIHDGESPISIIRTIVRYLQQLWQAKTIMVTSSLSAEQAMGQLKPPIFYQHQNRFVHHMRLWPYERLVQTFLHLSKLEIMCKTTGMPAAEIALQQLTSLVKSDPTASLS